MKKNGLNIVDIVSALGQLSEEGNVKEWYDEGQKELTYQITEQGFGNAKKIVSKNVESQLFLFSIVWNEQSKQCHADAEKYKLLYDIGTMFRDDFKVNVFRLLFAHQDKWHGGLKLKKQLTEKDEEFLKVFDSKE